MSKRTGLSLVELLVALAMSVIIIGALGTAYSAALSFETKVPVARRQFEQVNAFEDNIRKLFRYAYVSADTTDQESFFVANVNSQNSSTLVNSDQADEVVFTICGNRVDESYMETTETDFDTLNKNYGPHGGVTEVSLSTVAVGDAGDKTGLFLRKQTPADSDPTQGGYEQVLSPDVATIGFEFYDGIEWTSQWDTRTAGRRLPSAVRVSYTLQGEDSGVNHTFIAQIPNSDVTPDNPYDGSTGGTTAGTTAGGQ